MFVNKLLDAQRHFLPIRPLQTQVDAAKCTALPKASLLASAQTDTPGLSAPTQFLVTANDVTQTLPGPRVRLPRQLAVSGLLCVLAGSGHDRTAASLDP